MSVVFADVDVQASELGSDSIGHVNYPKKFGILAIIWYLGLIFTILFGLAGCAMLGITSWLLATDFLVFEDMFHPNFVAANRTVINAVNLAFMLISLQVFISIGTLAWTMVTRRIAFITTLLFNALMGFASLQIWSAAIFSFSKPGETMIEHTLLREANGDFDAPNSLLRYANERFGCCGVYDQPGGICDRTYPAGNENSCARGSSNCAKGCLEIVEADMFAPIQSMLSYILAPLALLSSIAFFWRFWSHRESRRHLAMSIPLVLLMFGIFLLICGCSGIDHDYAIVSQYVPTYVTVNKDFFNTVAIALIISGAVRLPFTITLYAEKAEIKHHRIAKLLVLVFMIIQLAAAFTAIIFYIVKFNKETLRETFIYELSNNITGEDSLLLYGNRRFQCCGINDIAENGGACPQQYPGENCTFGSLACAKGCLNPVWTNFIAPYSTICIGFLGVNATFVTIMALAVIIVWAIRRKQRYEAP